MSSHCSESDTDVNATDDDLQKPLALAVRNNRASVVELLLRVESIECEQKDKLGITPFLIAAELNDTNIMKQLLARGVKVQEGDNKHKNALHI
ncbi:hypothetical protein GGP41_000268 [Bipolaris sorokiniana]|uniref:Ankyrin repeat protein n=1 Tax=Cochliobolus sativus TaxID=45130 RepID=A0A8H6DV43_COCSA|nr:hypothetical protein GGP41_000268 [Bipolaris sorokiniana]